MATTQNMEQVRIHSGNNFKIAIGTTYETLGNIVSGKFTQKGNPVAGEWASGFKWKKRGSAEAGLMVVLGQVHSDIIKRINQLLNKSLKIYFYNGRDDNNEDMEIFAPNAIIVESIDLQMEGSKHQTIGLELSFNPAASGLATCIPNDDLPDDAYAAGVVAVDSDSPFYVMMNTVAV